MGNNIRQLVPLLLFIAVLSSGILSCKSDREADFCFEAARLDGEYNGAIGNDGEYNYYIHLSDKGFDSAGNALPEGTYYRFDIFSTAPGAGKGITIPEGRYILGPRGSTACGTFTSDYSLYFVNGTSGNDVQLIFSQGVLEVSYSGDICTFKAELTDIAGMTHCVSYNGPVSLTDNSVSPDLEIKPLDQDLYIFSDSITATNYGAVNGNGIYNIMLSLTDMPHDSQGNVITPGNILYMDCYASLTKDGDIIPGNYEILNYWGTQDFTMSPGEMINGRYVGTLAMHYNNNGSACLGLLSSGLLKISASGEASSGYDKSYTLEFNFLTEEGYLVTGSYEGPVNITGPDPDITQMEQKSAKRPVSTPFAHNCFQLK